MKPAIFALSLLLGTAAWASDGPGDGGGGVGIKCQQIETSEVYLADTYALTMKGAMKDLERAEPEAVVAAAVRVIEKLKPAEIYAHPYGLPQKVSLAWIVANRHRQLSYDYNSKPLPLLNDDHLDVSKLPPNCEKIQLAIQDIPKMKVELAPMRILDKLSWVDRGFLELHETFVSLRGMPGADTTPIRNEIGALADALNKQTGSLREAIMALLKADQVPNQEVTQASDDLMKYCKSTLEYSKPQKGESPTVTRCRRITQIIIKEDELHDLKTSLPTILAAPKEMNCLANGAKDGPLPIGKPKSIKIRVVKGPGLPGGYQLANRFEIELDGKKVQSKRSWFSTQRRHREIGNRAYGMTDLSAFFVTSSKKNITFNLREYDDFTGTFEGGLSFADPTVLSYPNDSGFRMTCYAGKLAMGLDLENSEPSKDRGLKQEDSIWQWGCGRILLADITRAKHWDNVRRLKALTSIPANAKKVSRYEALNKILYSDKERTFDESIALNSEIRELDQDPLIQLYREVLIISERGVRCVNFRGE